MSTSSCFDRESRSAEVQTGLPRDDLSIIIILDLMLHGSNNCNKLNCIWGIRSRSSGMMVSRDILVLDLDLSEYYYVIKIDLGLVPISISSEHA